MIKKNAKRSFKQGYYNIKNIEKYLCSKNGKRPFCRSSWEFKFCSYLDNSPYIKKWGSECIAIPYYDTVKQKSRKYFPDFYFEKITGEKFVVEIKPHRETRPPRNGKKKSKKTMLHETQVYETNQCKWSQTEKFCQERGFIFKIITEKQLFG